ncbi:MAG: DUF4003 domain-containing protein [Oscillospiraceae bacterium]|jgi:hypothetical protein|nr:DUF4003 domain-containing protein [Oscillospiraceae bacterium]
MQAYESTLHLFTANIRTIRKVFRWQNTLSVRLAAIILASAGKQADAKAMLTAKELIKRNAGVFSNLRGIAGMPLIALISQSERPQEVIGNTIRVQELLKGARFWRNNYLAVAAAQIALNTQPSQYTATVSRARDFYDWMRKSHPLITGADDYILSCMLAAAGLDAEPASAEMDNLMALLTPHFKGSPNVRQSLAQALVLGTSRADTSLSREHAVARIVALREALREKRLKPGAQIAAVLGILSLLPGEPEAIAEQVADCYAALLTVKGFSRIEGKQVILLFAASLVTCGIADELLNSTANAALANMVTNLIIAQQAAVIAATSAAAAASSSS